MIRIEADYKSKFDDLDIYEKVSHVLLNGMIYLNLIIFNF